MRHYFNLLLIIGTKSLCYAYSSVYIPYIYRIYTYYIADNLLQCRASCSAAIVEGRRCEGCQLGRMSNKQKLLKIIVAYLVACRNAGEWGGGRGRRCHCCLLLGASKTRRSQYPAQCGNTKENNNFFFFIYFLLITAVQWVA